MTYAELWVKGSLMHLLANKLSLVDGIGRGVITTFLLHCGLQGETALFLSALHGCYDTARFLLLNGANQELCDRRGRRPLDVAREGMHHQVLELLLAHRVHRGPVPIDPACEVLWDDRAYLYSPWAAAPCVPGRSASFSGSITPRGMSSPPPR